MKKAIIFIIALTFFSCSKDDVKKYESEITIVDHGWINPRAEYIKGKPAYTFDMYVLATNNTGEVKEGYFLFEGFMTQRLPYKFMQDTTYTLLPGESYKFMQSISYSHLMFYEEGYDTVKFVEVK